MALQHKYRPRNLDEIYGNTATLDSVRVLFARKRDQIPHAFLLTGTSGCGKTTLAYIIRDLLGCSESNFSEFDASTDRGINHIRKIKNDNQYMPLIGNVSVLFFDEVHGVTGLAQEAMLKLLENPPPHVYLILATTEPEKLKPTIVRRCHQFALAPLLRPQTMNLLQDICESEGKNVNRKVLGKISRQSWGSPGQAVKLLDQVIDIENTEKAIETLDHITYNEGELLEICRILVDETKAASYKWEKLKAILINYKGDAEKSRYGILSYMEKVLLDQKRPSPLPKMMLMFCDSFMYVGRPGLTVACKLAIQAEEEWSKLEIPF